jgi:spermidine/putrescine transport system permease protein
MSKASGGGGFAIGYSLLFFAFLFGPLIIMVITAFNSSSFPRILPWECFTTNWFSVLVNNGRLMSGLANSVIIGIGVVLLSVPIGLAGALALSDLSPALRTMLYTVLIVPILVPGVVIGISTVVFWGQVARAFGLGYESFFYDGIFLTLAGQISFIAAYAMLIFMARLQRFDPTLTEAALDLGATPGQAFRKIMLPFLKPAIGSAAFLTLLASFENYNTTLFTILAESTFTTALASQVRLGIDPSLSALAVIIIALTLMGALVNEAFTRRAEVAAGGSLKRSRIYGHPVLRLLTHPVGVGILLFGVAALLIWQGSWHDSRACEAKVLDEKRQNQERILREQRERAAKQQPSQTPSVGAAPSGGQNPSPFGGAFKPNTLGPGQPAPAPTPDSAPPPPTNPSPFGGAFDPRTLKPDQ